MRTRTAKILIVFGDNPERIRSEPGFRMLNGTSPMPASSGMTTRHRLYRGGVDRPTRRSARLRSSVWASVYPATSTNGTDLVIEARSMVARLERTPGSIAATMCGKRDETNSVTRCHWFCRGHQCSWASPPEGPPPCARQAPRAGGQVRGEIRGDAQDAANQVLGESSPTPNTK